MPLNVHIGDRFPDLRLPTFAGDEAQLSELVKNKPTILAFYRGYW